MRITLTRRNIKIFVLDLNLIKLLRDMCSLESKFLSQGLNFYVWREVHILTSTEIYICTHKMHKFSYKYVLYVFSINQILFINTLLHSSL